MICLKGLNIIILLIFNYYGDVSEADTGEDGVQIQDFLVRGCARINE